jgi:glycosyltransferase involved in cell wall biosynthesis
MLSIIIPALNEQQYLPSLLGSIIQQNPFVAHEVVIADAGSQDRTVEIALSYGCTVVPGGLAAKGRNQGGKAAKGDLLLFLDPEVLLPHGFLKRILSEFKERNLDIASCAIEPIVEKWMPRLTFPRFFFDLLYNWPARLSQNVFPYASTVLLVKKSIHDKLGGFNESIRIGEDHDYARRAAKYGRYGFLSSCKLPLFMRRYQRMGVLRTNLRYFLCNFWNALLGEVKSDIFKYNFGQYKGIQSEEGKNRRPKWALSLGWVIAYYIMLIIGLLGWIVFFLVLVSKLMLYRVDRFIALRRAHSPL